jgi:hypothetical protein
MIGAILSFLVILVLIVTMALGFLGYQKAHKICREGVCGTKAGVGTACLAVAKPSKVVSGVTTQFYDVVKTDVVFCKSDFDMFCDFETRAWVGLVLFIASFLAVFAAFICSCCAYCRPVTWEIDDPPSTENVA